MTNLDKTYFSVLPEVGEALEQNTPIVALESTVITHGLPFPQNLELAGELEGEIRENGCTPATIAILNGRICLGLEPAQLEQLVLTRDLAKISARDIAATLEAQGSGGTTVAGTLAIAEMARIKVFATGGIGGVHRHAPFDVSADLMQLGKSRLVVVCAGAKAILDIAATLEVLETYGVPVVGYQTDEFPAFYSTSSGFKVNARADTPEYISALAHTHWKLGFSSALLVAMPPPAEVALERDLVESAIDKALKEAQEKGIIGQAVTPFLLRRVSEYTGGDSMQANLGLLRNNARLAAKIAVLM
jgi:pseudouridylate synthase